MYHVIELEEMAQEKGLSAEAKHWKLILSKLDDLAFCRRDSKDSEIHGTRRPDPELLGKHQLSQFFHHE